MVSRQKSRVRGVIATQPVLFNGKSTKNEIFHVYWASICKKFVLYAIFCWWKPHLEVFSPLSQPYKYTLWSQKWRKSLFWRSSPFLTWHRLWRHSDVSMVRGDQQLTNGTQFISMGCFITNSRGGHSDPLGNKRYKNILVRLGFKKISFHYIRYFVVMVTQQNNLVSDIGGRWMYVFSASMWGEE